MNPTTPAPITVRRIVERIREHGTRDAEPNERGNTIIHHHRDSERYIVDFAPDFTAEGWEQFDTDQDAHYFGVWVNHRQRLTLTYAEGDWTLVECPTPETYRAELDDCCRFYGEGRIATSIGMDGSVTIFRQDRAAILAGAAEGGAA